MAFTTITLTGHYELPDSSGPASGSLQLRLTSAMSQPPSGNVPASPIQINLDGSGNFSKAIFATNDPTTLPLDVSYEVTENVGGVTDVYYIIVPYDAAGATIDISECIKVLPTPPPWRNFVTYEGMETALGLAGGGRTDIVEGPTTVSGATVLDWEVADDFDLRMTADTIFTIVNLAPGREITLTLRGAFTPSWPSVNAWRPSQPIYSDTGEGMDFLFWMTEANEIRAAAIVPAAPLASPTFTGDVGVPTRSPGDDANFAASTAYVDTACGLLVPKSIVTAPGQLLIASANGAVEALGAPSEIGQVPVMEGSDASTVQWGYTRTRRQRYLAPTGILAETIDQWQINGPQVMGGTGLVSFYAIALPKGLTIGHLNFRAAGTAATGPQHWWYALADNALGLLAVTADQTTTAFGASVDHPLAIATIAAGASSTFTTLYEGLYYIGIMMAVSTTMPTLAGFGMSSGGLANLGTTTPRTLGVSSDSVATAPPSFPHTFGAIGTTLVGAAYASVS